MENKEIYGVKGMIDIFDKPIEKGIAKISQFHFSEEENFLFNARATLREGAIFKVHTGDYVRLYVKNYLTMSDTGMERITNKNFIEKANGKVLIAGLGIGLIVRNILEKENVESITVVEKYQDVIDLVAPKFNSPKLKIICADIFDLPFPKKEKYDTIYFDIWADICGDNLEQIKELHKTFRPIFNKRILTDLWIVG